MDLAGSHRRVLLAAGTGLLAGVSLTSYVFYVLYVSSGCVPILEECTPSFFDSGSPTTDTESFLLFFFLPLVVIVTAFFPAMALGSSFVRSMVTSLVAYVPLFFIVVAFFLLIPLLGPLYTFPALLISVASVWNGVRTRKPITFLSITVLIILISYTLALLVEKPTLAVPFTAIFSWTILPTVAALLSRHSSPNSSPASS